MSNHHLAVSEACLLQRTQKSLILKNLTKATGAEASLRPWDLLLHLNSGEQENKHPQTRTQHIHGAFLLAALQPAKALRIFRDYPAGTGQEKDKAASA